jgi:hypothetical protein
MSLAGSILLYLRAPLNTIYTIMLFCKVLSIKSCNDIHMCIKFAYVSHPPSPVPEFIDPRFRENKPKTLVFSHRKRAFWACFRENCVYSFGHGCLSSPSSSLGDGVCLEKLAKVSL